MPVKDIERPEILIPSLNRFRKVLVKQLGPFQRSNYCGLISESKQLMINIILIKQLGPFEITVLIGHNLVPKLVSLGCFEVLC